MPIVKYHVIGSLLQWLLIVYVSSFSHCSRCLPRYSYCFRRPTFSYKAFTIIATPYYYTTTTNTPKQTPRCHCTLLYTFIHSHTYFHTHSLTRARGGSIALSPFHLYHDTTTTTTNNNNSPPTSKTSTVATLTK